MKRNLIPRCWSIGITSQIQDSAWRMNVLNKETVLKSAFFQNWNVMCKDDFSVWKVYTMSTQPSIFWRFSIILVILLSGQVYQFSQAGKMNIRCFLLPHSYIFSTTENLFKVCANGNQWRMWLGFSNWSEKLLCGSLTSLCSYSVQSTF